jgi:hypothetical protein
LYPREECNRGFCPAKATSEEWEPWSACTRSCDLGYRIRAKKKCQKAKKAPKSVKKTSKSPKKNRRRRGLFSDSLKWLLDDEPIPEMDPSLEPSPDPTNNPVINPTKAPFQIFFLWKITQLDFKIQSYYSNQGRASEQILLIGSEISGLKIFVFKCSS